MTITLEQPRGLEVARLVKTLAVHPTDPLGQEVFASARGWANTARYIKAVTNPVSMADIAAASAPIAHDLAAVLRGLTIVGRLQGLRRVPLNTRLLTNSVGGSGDWVGEGLPIPVRELELTTQTLGPLKVGAIRVLTTELVKTAASGSDQLIANEAASALVEAMDLAFFDPGNGGSASKPMAVTHGAPERVSTGSTLSAIDADLKAVLDLAIGYEMPLTSAHWVMSPTSATHLALLRGTGGAPAFPLITARGGELLGLPVITSTNVTASGSPGERAIALVEASEISLADDGEALIELSTETSLQFDDAPAAGDQVTRSLWQHGLAAIKATRFLNWKARRTGAAILLSSVNY